MYHFGGSNSNQVINPNNIHYGNDNRTPSSGTNQELQSPYMYSNNQIHQRNVTETPKENRQNAALESHQFMATTSATNRSNGNSSTALLRQWRPINRRATNQMKQQLSPTQQIPQSSPPLQHHNTNQILQQTTVAGHQINNNVQQQSQQYQVSPPSHITGPTGPIPQQMRQHYPTTNDILETHHQSQATKYYHPSLSTSVASSTTSIQPNLDQIMDVNYYNRNDPSAYYGSKNPNQPRSYPQNYTTYSPQMGYNKSTTVMNPPPPPPSVQTITQQISYQNHVAKSSLYRNYNQTNTELIRNRSFSNETTSSFPYDPYTRAQQKLISNDYYHQMGYKFPPPNNVYKKPSYIPSPYHPPSNDDYYKYQVNQEHTDMNATNYNNPSLGTPYDPNWLQCCSEMKSTTRYPCYPEPMIRKCNMNAYTPPGPPAVSYQQRLRYDEYNNFNYNSNVVKPQPVTPNKYPTWDQNKNYCTTISDKYPFHGYGTNSLSSGGTNYYNTENYLQPEKQVRHHQNISDPFSNYSNKQHFMYTNWRMNTQPTNGSEIIDFENHIKVNRTQKYEYENKSKLINLKEYIENWADEDGETDENQNNHTIINLPDVVLSNKASKDDENMLYILESTNIPEETVWSDYKHIQQIDKLPDNIKLVEEIKTSNELIIPEKLQHEFDAIIPDSTRCDTVIKSPDTTADCIQTTIEESLSILENDGDIVSSTCSVIKSPTGVTTSGDKSEKSIIEIKILNNSIVENVTTTYNNKTTIIDFETKDITVKCNGHCSFVNKCEQCQTDDIINELISPRISEICTQSNLSHYSSSKCGDEDEDDIEDHDDNSFNSISENEILDLRRADDDEKRFNFENLIAKLHTDNSPKSLTAICTEKYISEQFNVTAIAIKHDDTIELKMVDNEEKLNENVVLDLSERRNSQIIESVITDVKEFPHIKRHLSSDEHEVKSPKSPRIEIPNNSDTYLKSQMKSISESSESKIRNSTIELNPKFVQNDSDQIKMKSNSEQIENSETNSIVLKKDWSENNECFSKCSMNDNSNNLENECLKDSEILESTKNVISYDEIYIQNSSQNITESCKIYQRTDENLVENEVQKDVEKVGEKLNHYENNKNLSMNSETNFNCLEENDKLSKVSVKSENDNSISVQQTDKFPSNLSSKFDENSQEKEIILPVENHGILRGVCNIEKQELNQINLSKSSIKIKSEGNNEIDENVPKKTEEKPIVQINNTQDPESFIFEKETNGVTEDPSSSSERTSTEEKQIMQINNTQDFESFTFEKKTNADIEDPSSSSESEDTEDSKSMNTTPSDIVSYNQSPFQIENSGVDKINTPLSSPKTMNIERNEQTVIKTPLSSPELVKLQSDNIASVISNCNENSEIISNQIQQSDIENDTKQQYENLHNDILENEVNFKTEEEIEYEKQQDIGEKDVLEIHLLTETQSDIEIDIEKQHFGDITAKIQPQCEVDFEKQPINDSTLEAHHDDKIDIVEEQYNGRVCTETQSGEVIDIEKLNLKEITLETESECEIDIEKRPIDDNQGTYSDDNAKLVDTGETKSNNKIDIKKQCVDDNTIKTQSNQKIDIEKLLHDDTIVESHSEIDIEKQLVDDTTVESQSYSDIDIEKQLVNDTTVESQSHNEIDIEKQLVDARITESQSHSEIDIKKQLVDDTTVESQSHSEINIEKQLVDVTIAESQSHSEIDIEKQLVDDTTVESQSHSEIDIEKQLFDDTTVESQYDSVIDIKKQHIDDTEKEFNMKITIEKQHVDDIETQPDHEKYQNDDDTINVQQLDHDVDNEIQHDENIEIQHTSDKEFIDDNIIIAMHENVIKKKHNDHVSEKMQHDEELTEKEYSDCILDENEIDDEISIQTEHFEKMDCDERVDNIVVHQGDENSIGKKHGDDISDGTEYFEKEDTNEHVDNIVIHQENENVTGKEHVDDNIITTEGNEEVAPKISVIELVPESNHTDEISIENSQIDDTVETRSGNKIGLESQFENITEESEQNDHVGKYFNCEHQFVGNTNYELQDNKANIEEIIENGPDKDNNIVDQENVAAYDNEIITKESHAEESEHNDHIEDDFNCEHRFDKAEIEEIIENELDKGKHDSRQDNEKENISVPDIEIITEEAHVKSDDILIASKNTTENISISSPKTINNCSIPMDPWIQLTEDIIAQTKTSIFNNFYTDNKISENNCTNEKSNLNIESLSSLCKRKLDEKCAVKDSFIPSSPLPTDNCSEIYDQVCYEEVIDENVQSDEENENIIIEDSQERDQIQNDEENKIVIIEDSLEEDQIEADDTEVIDEINDENIVLIIESNEDESDETEFLDENSTIIIAFDNDLLESNNTENNETESESKENSDSIIEKEIRLEIENILTNAENCENDKEIVENKPQIEKEVSQNEEIESISNSPGMNEDYINEIPNLWLYTEEEVVSKFDEDIKDNESTASSISNEESESSELILLPKLNETDVKDNSIEKFDDLPSESLSKYYEKGESSNKFDKEIEEDEKFYEEDKLNEIIENENDFKHVEEIQFKLAKEIQFKSGNDNNVSEENIDNFKEIKKKSDDEKRKLSEIKVHRENIYKSKKVMKSDEEIDYNKKRRNSEKEESSEIIIDQESNSKKIKSSNEIDSNKKRRKSDENEKINKIKSLEEFKIPENKRRRKSDEEEKKSGEIEESNVRSTQAMKSAEEDIDVESKKRCKSNEEMLLNKSVSVRRTSSGSSSNETDNSFKTKENINDSKHNKKKFKYENFRGSCSDYERKRSKHEGKTSKYLPHPYKRSYHSKDSSKVIEKNNNSENFNANEVKDDTKIASSNVCNILNNYDKYFEQQRMVANYKIPKLSCSTSSKQEYQKKSLVVNNNNKTKSSDNKNSHGIKIKLKNITDQVYKSGYRNKEAGTSINQYKIINKHSINQSLLSSNKLINNNINNKIVPKVIIKRETSTNYKQNIINQTDDKQHTFATNLILNNAFKWQPFVRIVRDKKVDRMALKLYKQQKIILKINRVNNNDNYHYCSSESSETSSSSSAFASASYKSTSFKCRIKLEKNMLPAIVQSTEFNKD